MSRVQAPSLMGGTPFGEGVLTVEPLVSPLTAEIVAKLALPKPEQPVYFADFSDCVAKAQERVGEQNLARAELDDLADIASRIPDENSKGEAQRLIAAIRQQVGVSVHSVAQVRAMVVAAIGQSNSGAEALLEQEAKEEQERRDVRDQAWLRQMDALEDRFRAAGLDTKPVEELREAGIRYNQAVDARDDAIAAGAPADVITAREADVTSSAAIFDTTRDAVYNAGSGLIPERDLTALIAMPAPQNATDEAPEGGVVTSVSGTSAPDPIALTTTEPAILAAALKTGDTQLGASTEPLPVAHAETAPAGSQASLLTVASTTTASMGAGAIGFT